MLRRNSDGTIMHGHAPGLRSGSSRQEKSDNQGELGDEVQAERLTRNGNEPYTRGQRTGKSQKRCRICHLCETFRLAHF